MSKQPISIDNGTFEQDGLKYVLDARLQYNIGGKDYGISLSRTHINDIEISTQIDKLFSSGFIIYDDVNGDISRINGVFNIFCFVTFIAYKQEGDGSFDVEVVNKDQSFSHQFIVENVEIVDNGPITDCIRYCIHLTGIEYLGLMNRVQYHDYSLDDPNSIIQLVKIMLSGFGKLQLDSTFSGDLSGVKIRYISSGNDTVQSAIDYLMQKQFFFKEQRDDRIGFIVYDIHSGTYGYFSQTSGYQSKHTYTVFISVNDTNLSEFISRDKVVLASNSCFGKTKALRSISEITVRDFNMESNSFEQRTFKSTSLTNFFGGKKNKLVPIVNDDTTYFQRDYSEWDNDSNVYKDFLDAFMGWDSIIVNTGGIIGRSLMDVVTIAIDDRVETDNASSEQAKEQMSRYEQLKGGWFVTKVRYIIEPSKGKFTQNLQLSRTMNMKTQS